MAVPYTFATATSSIPLSQLDANFATGITLGNTTVYLGNTTTSIGNLTLTNATISSVATTFPNSFLANSSVTIGSTNISLGGTSTTLAGLTGVTSSAITDSGLTSGRVTYATTGGLLTDSAGLTYDGTNLGLGTSTPSTGTLNRQLTINSGANNLAGVVLQSNATGTAYNNGTTINLVNGTDFNIINQQNGYFVLGTNNLERMRIDSSGNVGIGTSSPATTLQVAGTATLKTSTGGTLNLDSTTTSTANTIGSYANNGAAFGDLNLSANNTIFLQGGAEKMRISSTGNVGIGTSAPAQRLTVIPATDPTTAATATQISVGEATNNSAYRLYAGYFNDGVSYKGSINAIAGGTGTSLVLNASGGRVLVAATTGQGDGKLYSKAVNGSYAALTLEGNDTAGQYVATFYNANGFVGSIVTSGSSTAFNTSSDYRLKENIAPMQNALTTVAQLKPVTYKWKVDGSDGQGFIAHELQEIMPDCVTGEKDAVDENGNPKYQGVDTSFLVATLTKAIQEQQALIESLTQRLTALENK